MKQLVAYSSQGGNTRKLAEAAFSRLSGEKDIFPVAQAPDPSGYDLVIMAFWFKGGQPDQDSQEYLRKCAGGTRVFLIGCHGSAPDSNHARMGMNKAKELASGANIVGSFDCQGEVPQNVLDSAANKDPQPDWLQDAHSAQGHPNNEDIYNMCIEMEKSGVVETPKPGEKRMFS
ncbi:MAG TPA: flavodoxin family protein [Desulfobacteraceae bacterium]|nr:flavodoxin family protein [Desulfobacteraceae bacterium]